MRCLENANDDDDYMRRRDEMRDSERRKIEKDREVMNDMRIL